MLPRASHYFLAPLVRGNWPPKAGKGTARLVAPSRGDTTGFRAVPRPDFGPGYLSALGMVFSYLIYVFTHGCALFISISLVSIFDLVS